MEDGATLTGGALDRTAGGMQREALALARNATPCAGFENGWVRPANLHRKPARRPLCCRRLAAQRRRAHGELANRIAGQETTVKTGTLSYRAFQRAFGKRAGVRARPEC
jgi:hypothetical protein